VGGDYILSFGTPIRRSAGVSVQIANRQASAERDPDGPHTAGMYGTTM